MSESFMGTAVRSVRCANGGGRGAVSLAVWRSVSEPRRREVRAASGWLHARLAAESTVNHPNLPGFTASADCARVWWPRRDPPPDALRFAFALQALEEGAWRGLPDKGSSGFV
jgi:hypothetical protein